jgi:hypothetical protein
MPASTLTPARARRLLDTFRASGSSQAAFCKQNRVSISLFSYWQRRLQMSASTETSLFREVMLPPLPSSSVCILTFPGGARLEFPASDLGTVLHHLAGGNAPC